MTTRELVAEMEALAREDYECDEPLWVVFHDADTHDIVFSNIAELDFLPDELAYDHVMCWEVEEDTCYATIVGESNGARYIRAAR